MNILLLLILITALLFFPIKIKLSLIYKEKSVELYFYKIKLYPTKKEKKIKEKKVESTKPQKPSKKIINYSTLNKINSFFIKNKFRPSIKLMLYLDYALEDAMLCALSYGFLHSLSPLPYLILRNYLNVHQYKFDVKPTFNNNFININGKCIICFNLANIIYIAFNLIYIILKNKGSVDNEYSPNR